MPAHQQLLYRGEMGLAHHLGSIWTTAGSCCCGFVPSGESESICGECGGVGTSSALDELKSPSNTTHGCASIEDCDLNTTYGSVAVALIARAYVHRLVPARFENIASDGCWSKWLCLPSPIHCGPITTALGGDNGSVMRTRTKHIDRPDL